MKLLHKVVLYISMVVVVFLAWQVSVIIFSIPAILLPAPLDVFRSLIFNFEEIARHSVITFVEAMLGCLISIVFAYIISVFMLYNKLVKKVVFPVLVVVKTTPVVCIAPLLAVYIGAGLANKVLIAFLISYFPLLINVYAGLSNLDQGAEDYLQTIKIKWWQALVWVRIKNSLSYFFEGLKIAVPLSFIGAVVGELVVVNKGLGYLIKYADSQYFIAYEFAIIIFLSLVANLVFFFVIFAEKKIIHWNRKA